MPSARRIFADVPFATDMGSGPQAWRIGAWAYPLSDGAKPVTGSAVRPWVTLRCRVGAPGVTNGNGVLSVQHCKA